MNNGSLIEKINKSVNNVNDDRRHGVANTLIIHPKVYQQMLKVDSIVEELWLHNPKEYHKQYYRIYWKKKLTKHKRKLGIK